MTEITMTPTSQNANPADWGAVPVDGPAHWGAVPVESGDGGDAFPDKPPEQSAKDTAIGLAQAGGVGIAKGTVGLAGLPGDAQALLKKGVSYLADKLPSLPAPDPESMRLAERYGGRGDMGPSFPLPSSADIQGLIEKVTGPFREPKNQLEHDAQTVGEFLPAALIGPGGLARKVVTQDLIPAAATVTAGRFSDQNPYVKALAGFTAGVVGVALNRPGQAAEILAKQLPDFVTEKHITRAGNLIEAAKGRGIDLTWPEALSKVTGQPVLTDTQRILESHGQTRPQMESFFSQRPGQVENAVRSELDNIGGQHPNPSNLGAEASATAGGALDDMRGHINAASAPFYHASESVLLTPAEMQQVKRIPGYQEARDAIRETPQLNWRVQHLPDNSVGFLNEVKKHFDQAAQNAGSKFAQNPNHQISSTHEMAASAVKQIGLAKSEQHAIAHGGPNNYEAALDIQSQLREQFLDPLLKGPLGKIADQPETSRAIAALFPTGGKLLPGMEGEVRNAVFAIAQKRPAVAEQLVRAHAEMVFNAAAKDLQGGANQFSGAKFSVMLTGNPQQRANLKAAVEALPHGPARWEGFEALLDIVSATGTRQPKGSLTAFNDLEVKGMSGAGLASIAAKGASPSKWTTAVHDAYKSWSLGKNLDQLARIITSPGGGEALKLASRIPTGSDRAAMVAGRLISQLGASTTEQRQKPN